MATFLDLVRKTRLLSGMQGTGPSSVVGAVGIESVLVESVVDAYLDIQNLREEWDFLRASQTFTTVINQESYNFLDIFLTETPDFKKYDKRSFYITHGTKKYKLKYLEYDEFEARYINSDNQGRPSVFTIDPMNNGILLEPLPECACTVQFRYWKNPETLTEDSQIPSLPTAFHNLILYRAIRKMAVYLNNPEAYAEYKLEDNKMTGQLMRLNLRKKRIRTGSIV